MLDTTKDGAKEVGKEIISSPFIGVKWDVPECEHYAHITRGYRVNFNSYKSAFKSLCLTHNESVNIWSHLISSILFALLICYLLYLPSSPLPIWPLYLYVVMVAASLALSAQYHLFYCCSEQHGKCW